jgi:RHS repeat-associated protein
MRLALLGLTVSTLPLHGAYSYWFTENWISYEEARWTKTGSATVSANGFYTPAGQAAGSAILKTNVPDQSQILNGQNEYEVRGKVTLASGGGSYILYLRASSNALLDPNPSGTSVGSFIAIELRNPTFTNGVCAAGLAAWVRPIGQGNTNIVTATVPCADGMEIRAIASANRFIRVYINEVLYLVWQETTVDVGGSYPDGKPGIGGYNMPAGNGISRVDLGLLDRTAPTPLAQTAVATAVFDQRVEMQWTPTDDGPNGIGVAGYHYFRDGNYLGFRRNGELVDLTVSPGTTYTYSLQPEDFHGNQAGLTNISVTTPAAGNIDPRQIGVRPLGTYWGALGEQIDLQSGNVNYSMPLFKAQSRGGWGVTFALSYNSQNWRRDTEGTARTWNHGRDIGYGYGWRFLAGALTPLFTTYTQIGMYRFTDSTGAEYRLRETSPGSGEWVAKDGLFITYKSAEQKLYFPDGSWWYFGSIAGGTEMDLGTTYPTLFEDRTGNQIKVRYKEARGGTQINGSGRVWQVEDVRVSAGTAAFTCSYVADALQHLNTCTTAAGLNTGENYQVGIGAVTGLTDPFLGASFGDKQTLNGITNITPGVNSPFYFGYDGGATNGPGELTAAVYPYGGSLSWSYAVGTLAGGRQFRKVATRAYNANDGQGAKTATLAFYPGSNSQLPVHEWSVVFDPTNTAHKAWWWDTNLGSATMGLNAALSERRMVPAWADVSYKQLTWALTGNGNPYVASVLETMDPGTAFAKAKRTTQVISNEGNLKVRMEYPDGTSTTELRKYEYWYEAEGVPSSPYTQRHIRSLLKKVVASRPASGTQTAQTITLVENFFDQYGVAICDTQRVGYLADMPGATHYDLANYPTSMPYRGNVTLTSTPGGARCSAYNTGGMAVQSWDGYGHSTTVTPDEQKNYAVPKAMTTGSYTSTATFDSTLNLTQNAGPNGAVSTFGWDGLRRATYSTSPNGQTLNHEYAFGQSMDATWHKVTTGIAPNLRWTKTVLDGFGRTKAVITGYKVGSTETAVSKVVTEYTPCACSPIGKVLRVSMPFPANGSPAQWTTYEYDALGRTIKVTPPGNAGFTSYVYEGWTVKTVDPKGNWKKLEQDAVGNLVKVYEPRPGGGADYVTEYTYSVLAQLTKVRMERPGMGGILNPATVVQERTFVYNNEQRLQSVTHPESGTTSYSYNFDGTVKDKTDAMSQKVEWSYDAQARPVDVRKYRANGTEEPCGRVRYFYDGQPIVNGVPLDPTFSGQNLAARLAVVETGCTGQGGVVQELYSYNVAGAVLTKRVRITRSSPTAIITKDIGYSFDAEGKLATMQYPDVATPFTYFYDAMGRPNRMTGVGSSSNTIDHVSGVSYGVGGELLGMTYLASDPLTPETDRYFGESRIYNNRLQLTRQTTYMGIALATDIKYNFSATANDGRIESRENVMSGEAVSYLYDSLSRLVEAKQTAGPTVGQTGLMWGLNFTYDGFGNRWDQTIINGKAGITSTLQFNQSLNRILGQSYDANGNMTGGFTYDVDNRLLTASNERYGYLADNKRFWKGVSDGQGGYSGETYYLYGVGGQRIASYGLTTPSGVLTWQTPKLDVAFGGRVIRLNGVGVVQDRLGSVVTRANGTAVPEQHRYYPYGEEVGTGTPGDRNKFGTYHRDQTGLDYADQRYYVGGPGRFLTVDPSNPQSTSDPRSWNPYLYVDGDPVNLFDPEGLASCGDISIIGGVFNGRTLRSIMTGTSGEDLLAQTIYNEAGEITDFDIKNQFAGYNDELASIASAVMNQLDVYTGKVQIWDGFQRVCPLGKCDDVTMTLFRLITQSTLVADGDGKLFDEKGKIRQSGAERIKKALNSDFYAGTLVSDNGITIGSVCEGLFASAISAAKAISGERRKLSNGAIILAWDQSSPNSLAGLGGKGYVGGKTDRSYKPHTFWGFVSRPRGGFDRSPKGRGDD